MSIRFEEFSCSCCGYVFPHGAWAGAHDCAGIRYEKRIAELEQVVAALCAVLGPCPNGDTDGGLHRFNDQDRCWKCGCQRFPRGPGRPHDLIPLYDPAMTFRCRVCGVQTVNEYGCEGESEENR